MLAEQKNEKKQCHECFKVLADPTRIRIVQALQKESSNVSDLTQEIGLSQPTVSYHLKMLDSIGLVSATKNGRETEYAFNKNYPCRGCGVFSTSIKI